MCPRSHDGRDAGRARPDRPSGRAAQGVPPREDQIEAILPWIGVSGLVPVDVGVPAREESGDLW
jgi:hypothetical protein